MGLDAVLPADGQEKYSEVLASLSKFKEAVTSMMGAIDSDEPFEVGSETVETYWTARRATSEYVKSSYQAKATLDAIDKSMMQLAKDFLGVVATKNHGV